MKDKIAPSMMCCIFLAMGEQLATFEKNDIELLHIDVMDGSFVPNISFGFPVLEAVAKHCQKPLDVHLMIVDPGKFTPQVKALGAHIMNVHYEACPHLHRTIQQIHHAGMQAGVTLNPHTPVHVLEDIIQDIDMVLLMTVNPGFGGQQFIEHSIQKVKKLKELIQRTGSHTLIQVDGGVNADTAPRLVQAGVDVLVAGSYVFGAEQPEERIKQLKQIQKN